MYKILNYLMEDEKKDLFIKGTIYDNNKKIVGQIFDEGARLDKKDIGSPFVIIADEKQSNLKNKQQKDKVSLSTINAGNLFLGSGKVENLFMKLGIKNIQFFDVKIESSIGDISEYKLLNITDKIDCADFKSSDLVLFSDGDIKRIKKLVLDQTKIPKEKQIFLLDKYPTQVIVVHDDLIKAIEEAGLTGFNFVNLEDAGSIY